MKLLVFAVEGTIFKAKHIIEGAEYSSTMWQQIAQKLGDAAIRREKEFHARFANGEFCSHLDWVEASFRMHRELNLDKQTFDDVLARAEYNPGVREFFEKLNRKKFIPVLISGEFHELINRAQRELNIKHGYAACQYIFNENDNLLSSICNLTPCDFDGKYAHIKLLLNRYKLGLNSDWIFVGDGKNDVDIARKASVSFAFNGHPELNDVVTYRIDDDPDTGTLANFSELMEYLDLLEERDYRERGEARKKTIARNTAKIAEEHKQANRKHPQKKGLNEIVVQEEDYLTPPVLNLAEILKSFSIAFVGQQTHYGPFKTLEERYKGTGNFKLIEANFEHKNNANYKALKRRSFVFIDVSCISHSQGWRVSELGIPYAKIKGLPGRLNDAELLECAMSNVLYRYMCEQGIAA